MSGIRDQAWDYDAPELDCPMCDHECDYHEGTIDQTEQGNDITGYWFTCTHCEWESKIYYD